MATDTTPLLPVTPRPRGASWLPGRSASSPTPSDSSLPSITSLEVTPARPIAGRGVAIDIDNADEYEPSIGSNNGQGRDARWAVKLLALLTACLLSLGSHYGSYLLGPLKTKMQEELGTTNAQFSLLIASFGLNNTWTPLVAGILTARKGTAFASVLATSLILCGQAIILFGRWTLSVPAMALGCFVFGLGISPLAVAQETIICRFFSKHGLGISLALGLVAGKGASFVSSLTSLPLSNYSPLAPFIVSTLLALLSFLVNIVYLVTSRWLAVSAGVKPEQPANTDEIAGRRKVKVADLCRLGDTFWIYMGLNVLCGSIWSPFLHLAANIIQRRFQISQSKSANAASLLLAGPIILYPLCGLITDSLQKKHRNIVHWLFLLSSALTLFCYAWLSLPTSWTQSPVPGVAAWGLGHGFSTLLLVIVVPGIVPVKYVSTALGAHKSIEMAGSTLSQTLAGLLLDVKPNKHAAPEDDGDMDRRAHRIPPDTSSVHRLLLFFLVANVLQLVFVIWLWRVDVAKTRKNEAECAELRARGEEAVCDDEMDDPEGLQPLIERYRTRSMRRSSDGVDVDLLHGEDLVEMVKATKGMARSKAERRRGRYFMWAYGALVLAVWIVFGWTAIQKLHKPQRA